MCRLITVALAGMAGLCAVGLCRPLDADLVKLKNGGEIRGTVVRQGGTVGRDEVTIVTLTGASIVIDREDMQFVTLRSIKIELYEDKLKDLSDTVEAHWELAQWCQEQRLKRQRLEQLEAILLIDPEHAEAHRLLRHTLHNGDWLTREELMSSRGYVRHKNRWVTQQELDLTQKTAVERDSEQKWYPKVRLWLGWLMGRSDQRRTEGFKRLQTINDPNAIVAMRRFLSEYENTDVRMLFISTLAGIDDPKSLPPLVERSLKDPEFSIRAAAIEAIPPERYEPAAKMYVSALKHELVDVVRRAAVALRTVGTEGDVDKLIDALVTSHRYKVTVRVQDRSYSVGGNGGIGFANGSTLPPEVEAGLRTGQYPYGVVVKNPPAGVRTKRVTIKRDETNREVRETLRQLTDQDFGYDERTWRLWWTAKQSGP